MMWLTDVKAGIEITLTEDKKQIGKIFIVEKSHGGLQLSVEVPSIIKIIKSQERNYGSETDTLGK